jgi:hypothetical protein
LNSSLYVFGFICLAMALAVGLRILADRLDRSRIRKEIAASGGEVLDIRWSPFGRGWFGERSNRIYEVTYRTTNGKTLTATCKTSLFTGIFWLGDAPPS